MSTLVPEAPDSAAADQETDEELIDESIDDDQSDNEADDSDSDDDEAVPEAEVASSRLIALPSLEPIAVQPVFAGLASLIDPKSTLLLAIAKLSNGQLRVTVQPSPAKDEPAETVLPLSVTGTIEELDREFVEAFAAYKPARDYAVASAAETVRATKAAADQARADADAKRNKISTSSGRKPSGTLIVKTTPADAAITVAANDGKTHKAKSGESLSLPVGKATITATLAGHGTKLSTVTIANGKTETIELDLPAAEPSLF